MISLASGRISEKTEEKPPRSLKKLEQIYSVPHSRERENRLTITKKSCFLVLERAEMGSLLSNWRSTALLGLKHY